MILKNVSEVMIDASDFKVCATLGIKKLSLIRSATNSQDKRITIMVKIVFKTLIQGRLDLFIIIEFIVGKTSANKI